VKAELNKLIELQITDTNIRRLENLTATVSERRAEIENEFERRAFEIRELENTRDAARAEHGRLERAIAEAQDKLEKADRNLKASQNQKEYEAAMRANDTLVKEIAELETKLAENVSAVEEAEKVIAERAGEIAGLESERQAALAAFEAQFSAERGELENENKKRAEIFAGLPRNYAASYDRLAKRSKDGIAVAEVVNSSCSACFMSLRPQMMIEIKTSDQVMSCESCGRILYIVEEKAETVVVA
jgi:hypothetical protein